MKIFLFLITLTVTVACNQKPGRPVQNSGKQSSIAILPYNGFDSSLLRLVIQETEDFYHCKTMVLVSTTLPANAYYEPRQRYRADSLLAFQKTILPDNATTIVGLTGMDISTSNGKIKDWGVLGLGYCPGNACVISTYRLGNSQVQLFKERFIKVILHELGHNLGLPHCRFAPTCLMNDAKGAIAQVDKEKKWLCPHCKSLLEK